MKQAVTHAHILLERLLAPEMSALGLSTGEADVLSVLLLNPRPLLPGEIASQLNITGPGATGRLNSLERSGHIKRVRNPDDGRSVIVHLTESGRTLADAVVEQKNATIDDTLTGRMAPAATDDLVEQLNALVGHLYEQLDST